MEENRIKKIKIAFILSGILVIIIPFVILFISLYIDDVLDFPNLFSYPLNYIIGIPISIIGYFWVIWANYTLYKIGKGSPVPKKSTETIFLIESGPYLYCRNPMIFGYILLIVGLGIIFNSITLTFIISSILTILFILRMKLIEEKDLEMKFGESYINYKKNTSFLIPWFPKRK